MPIEQTTLYAPSPRMTRATPLFVDWSAKFNNICYPCGNSILLRNIDAPVTADIYSEHQYPTTVATFAPSGFYCASADETGSVRIWDMVNKTHILKLEVRALGGPIRDLAWTGDSKRIAVVGDGRSAYGSCFLWDSGSSCGEITGHTSRLMSCSLRGDRPYKLATGGEDKKANWYNGVPYKFAKTAKTHERQVNCIRFSPDGKKCATASSDKVLCILDGTTGDIIKEIPNAHAGGIYSVSWSPDSAQLLTASADNSCKVWNMETYQSTHTFTFPKGTDFQQLGCLWTAKHLLSFSLGGDITYLNLANPERPQKVLHGHNGPVKCLTFDNETQKFFASSGPKVHRWELVSGETTTFVEAGHTGAISNLSFMDGKLVSVSNDGVRISDGRADSLAYGPALGFEGDSKGMSCHAGLVAVVSHLGIAIVYDGKITFTKTPYTPSSCALSRDGTTLVVGEDNTKAPLLHVYKVSGSAVSLVASHKNETGVIGAADFSFDGKRLVTGDSGKYVHIWETTGWTKQIESWSNHTASVQQVAWHRDNIHLCSVSLGGDLIVWDTSDTTKKDIVLRAHHMGAFDALWVSESSILTCGQDACIKRWDVQLK